MSHRSKTFAFPSDSSRRFPQSVQKTNDPMADMLSNTGQMTMKWSQPIYRDDKVCLFQVIQVRKGLPERLPNSG